MTRHLRLSLLVAAALLPACKDPCIALAEKICACEANATAQNDCVTRATNEQQRVTETAEDQDRCKALVDKCDCHQLSTTEGKRNCGLAR